MLSVVSSCGLLGLEVFDVVIETDSARGLPAMIIVGLPDNAVKESRERVRAAVKNSGYTIPPRKITINLSPADIKKEGPAYDLPIALSLLASLELIPTQRLKDHLFIGELSLDGSLRPVKGVLNIVLWAASKKHIKGVVVPKGNANEAAVGASVPVYALESLLDVIRFLEHKELYSPLKDRFATLEASHKDEPDFSEVKGHAGVKRGLEIAAAGGHNCLMVGPPGVGKSMLAQRLPSILPPMTRQEALETTGIHSLLGCLPDSGLMTQRPFRSPHHTASDIALVGGGTDPRPGEVTLAHNGVLFLDELPEFSRRTLEALRQPMEEGFVTVARALKTVRFPARFMLVASLNPCPCGHFMNPRRACHCTPQQIQRYLGKISGPLLDRIDVHLEVPPLDAADIVKAPPAEPSAAIRDRVLAARQRQWQRFQNTGIHTNAQMRSSHLKRYCILDKEAARLLKESIQKLNFSARAHDKILKISRTIADLEGNDTITVEHIAEAIQYRSLDRNWWG